MKRAIILLIILGLTSTICFAEKAAVPKKTAAFYYKDTKEYVATGYVETVISEDPKQGEKSKIIIVTDDNKRIIFFVKKTTTIYDADMRAKTLSSIFVKARITVRFRSDKEGFYEALSIIESEN
jgi:outer membrane lipoprotein-sorting protein